MSERPATECSRLVQRRSGKRGRRQWTASTSGRLLPLSLPQAFKTVTVKEQQHDTGSKYARTMTTPTTTTSSTWNTFVVDLQVGFEVSRTRLNQRIEDGDKHGAVLSTRAAFIQLRQYVGPTTHRLTVR